MAQKEATESSPHARSFRPAVWLAGSALVGLIGDKLQHRMPEQWRGDGGLWDVWSHIGNVPDSMLAVAIGAGATALARGDIFRLTSLKRACTAAGFGLAAGVGVNIIFETPAIAETAVMHDIFPHADPDPWDALYGDLASVAEASLLLAAMRQREPRQPALLEATEIPRLPDGNDE